MSSMYIHRPQKKLSTAENLLMMLRPDKQYTELEARVLDTALVLHMEHGGGNNSTFTTRVVTSSGSDTYSGIAGSTFLPEGTQTWWCQYQSRRDDAGYRRACVRLDR